MSTSTEPARGAARRPAARAADPPGEVPADLRVKGWALKEHVDDKGSFKCENRGLKLSTSPSPTPQLAFEAARRLQAKEDKKKGAAAFEGDPRAGAVSRRFTQTLKTRLSAEGLQEKCVEYDAACAEKERMEADFKKIHDRHKEDLKEQEARVAALSQVVRKQYVETEVECEERMDYEAKKVRVVRLDTNETHEERDMTPEELQMPLASI